MIDKIPLYIKWKCFNPFGKIDHYYVSAAPQYAVAELRLCPMCKYQIREGFKHSIQIISPSIRPHSPGQFKQAESDSL